MSHLTQFRNWTITGNSGGTITYGASAGLFNYQLTAADPVPGTGPTPQPFSVPAPTNTVRYMRRPVPGSPSIEIVPEARTISGMTSPRQRSRFGLTFLGAGGGPGIPLGVTMSTSSDASSTGSLYFIGPSRSFRDLQGGGIVIDGGISMHNRVCGIQVLVMKCPNTILGQLIQLARRIDRALEAQGSLGDPIAFFRSFFSDQEAVITLLAGESTGTSLGLTLYGGLFGTMDLSLRS
jgi:hypothetical protein